ncbi:MAG: glycosyltransferase family 4 protein, partial [Pseudomonadota bacterium]
MYSESDKPFPLESRPMLRSLKSNLLTAIRRRRVAKPAGTAAEFDAAVNGPIVVAGLFRTASGIGESARLCADSLEKSGIAVTRVDLSDAFRQTDLLGDSKYQTFPDEPIGTLILHFNAPETLKALARLGYRGDRKWRVIGYWVYELETIPKEWSAAETLVSEIWTPSKFSAEAIAKAIGLPVRVVPHPVSISDLPHPTAETVKPKADGVTVLTMADGRSSLERKNLLGAINAFNEGLGGRENCRLILKTRNLQEHQGPAMAITRLVNVNPQIALIDHALPEDERRRLMASCDIFLSLHRSEGFGLTMAEAMAFGKPVVATGWSGNLDFMDDTCAVLTPYTLVDV